MATTGSNPFMPVKFTPGPPTPQQGVWEDGPGQYVNTSGVPIKYSGSDQTSVIVNVNPKPPRQTHPAAGDKNDSKIK
jgi:hypothetical protein